ncbi:MAG: alpha-1,4-glucan--maltose-1-phosphate maltosyltransferase [Pirellulales bacterium]|nr:alpha-1,4-glucan--maltose-1-phosphate maltosyltransferase [Pirellulales bacterium]
MIEDNDYGRRRVVIETVSPQVDGGRFAIKRVAGEKVAVRARIFADGHDVLGAMVKFRAAGEAVWQESPLQLLGNDWWQGEFRVPPLGRCQYTIAAWIDPFATWQRDLRKRLDAGQDVTVELQIGADLVRARLEGVSAEDRQQVTPLLDALADASDPARQTAAAVSEELGQWMFQHAERRFAVELDRPLDVIVDRPQARFSTWYEMFPRSCAAEPGRHGTLKDCEARLPYVAEMGFDVLYLPPIHPVGRSYRKGKNNAVMPAPEDVGCPWAIGAEEGGHKAVHPNLGTLEDFRRLVARAAEYGIEIALDIAFQCSPDHPYLRQHPEWFRRRPDGTIQYAENPPKKYEDIYPFNFECDDWKNLWQELKSIFIFWAEQGVRIFRVDNPHTKAFAFWEWLITEVKATYPDALFLAEAFTRPAVMYRLAKLGFTQSYTYFTWRNTKAELTEYFTELTRTPVREFFRANLWPNTPDILNEYLQFGGRAAFMARYVLAATLGANCGIYGPPFELCVAQPLAPGSEEYLNSEKYEIRHWPLEAPESLRGFIARVNRIRRENPALQADDGLAFHPVDNPQLICYSKQTEDHANVIVTAVNLDPHHTQWGWVELPLDELGIDAEHPYQAHDLLGDGRYIWNGPRNYVELDPGVCPAQVFRMRRRVRSESQFEYFL